MIPDRKGDRWYEKKAIVEALATVPPILAAAVGALTSLSDQQKRGFGWWLFGGAVWLAGASVAKVLHARAEDRHRKRTEDYDGYRAALHLLFTTVCASAQVPEGERTVRATIHRVVQRARGQPAEELEQMLPYFGGPGSQPGRRFSIRSGIIGRAARRKSAIVAVRECTQHEEFIGELVRDWAYTEHDARRLSPDRYAWMAVPVLSTGGTTVAVVYLDSTEREFFTEPLQYLILAVCAGITAYTREAYQ